MDNIVFGSWKDSISEWIKTRRCILLTDTNLRKIYGEELQDFEMLEFSPGESLKTLANLETAANSLLKMHVQRQDLLIGFGGGVICDFTNFLASVYMRGIESILVPTSLLAMVDASIGGKTGVNLGSYKNIVGTFNHAQCVILDVRLLKSLASFEFENGMAEVIKHALINSKQLYNLIMSRDHDYWSGNPEELTSMVHLAADVKRVIVLEDYLEKGQRKILNLAHTVAHAIEKVYEISHGRAVAYGLYVDALLSLHLGYISDMEYEEFVSLLKNYNLLDEFYDLEKCIEFIHNDKKSTENFIDYPIIKGIGDVRIDRMNRGDLAELLLNINQEISHKPEVKRR